MKVIDKETARRILDAADIVEVVSDFVTLKRRGANYIGLCPFHNERTPSFSVSKAKGICKCFSCGKGGSPVNFIMEHEQMSYQEALRYLAKKYNIEIRERELSDKEKEEASERESLLAINDFAQAYFCRTLTETTDGKDIGLAYFQERGISMPMIERFKLGYCLESNDNLYKTAIAKGFSEKHLLATGLCAKSERGTVYDKYHGRVIFPIHSVSGRVVGFGARTLRKDKNVAKYMNSPESSIYKKSYELYGIFQAKSAIAKQDKCLLVEGYMDVISMHQAGVENVVASSGTSLTEGQIRLIHRFTNNVTVVYDSDPAGIKASLRGIDMLLAEGLNIKVLLLPEGDDPDSFSQSHSSAEVMEYIVEHETDFISFKTKILLKDAANDPVERAKVINDIVRSIAVIPDPVVRAVYLAECSRALDINEKVLSLQTSKMMSQNAEQAQKKQQFQQAQESLKPEAGNNLEQSQSVANAPQQNEISPYEAKRRRQERVLAKYIIKYGLVPIAETIPEEGSTAKPFTVLDFIVSELTTDEIDWTDPIVKKIVQEGLEAYASDWEATIVSFKEELEQKLSEERRKERERLRQNAKSLADIENGEAILQQNMEARREQEIDTFTIRYLEDMYLSSPDDEVRQLSTALAAEKYQLSKVHSKYAKIETERDRLQELVQRAVSELKLAVLDQDIAMLNEQIKAQVPNPEKVEVLMKRLFSLYHLKAQFSKFLGERIVIPRP